MNVLYIGSGNSAKYVHQLDHTKYITVCVNNAWRLFTDNKVFDYWLHSGDFPHENYPNKKNFKYEISNEEYEASIKNLVYNKLKLKESSPCHYVGYTIFFIGLHWIMHEISPANIFLLGFDHDYNRNKTQKWLNNGQPNPQNQYLKDTSKSIKEWSDNFFYEFEHDFFYGHGTPDPMRLGENYIKEKFFQAANTARQLNVNIFNASLADGSLNIFPKIKI
jgi:hypothetical protein